MWKINTAFQILFTNVQYYIAEFYMLKWNVKIQQVPHFYWVSEYIKSEQHENFRDTTLKCDYYFICIWSKGTYPQGQINTIKI